MHEALEAELAAFKDVPAVLTFQSGFTANTGVIPTITGETDLIVSDALNHASIIDGMRLSKAPRKVYPHADVEALREILARGASETGRPGGGEWRLILVVTDGVFSMDGDIAPLPEIVEAAEEFGAAVMVDDAHASGVLGRERPRLGRPLRPARPRRDPGRHAVEGRRLARRLRGGLQALREILTQRARPVPLLDVASAGRRRGLPRGDPGDAGRARAPGAAVGEHPLLQGRADPPRASIPAHPRRRSRRS